MGESLVVARPLLRGNPELVFSDGYADTVARRTIPPDTRRNGRLDSHAPPRRIRVLAAVVPPAVGRRRCGRAGAVGCGFEQRAGPRRERRRRLRREVLNCALTPEHLESAFYRDGLGRFDDADFKRSKTLNGFGNRVRNDVRRDLVDIGAHEKARVDTLTTVVEALGDDPFPDACDDPESMEESWTQRVASR